MTVNIPISAETEAKLRARAAFAGIDFETYLLRQLEEIAERTEWTLGEISGAAYEEFLASGMTDDELGDLLEQAKHEMRAERRRRNAS